MNLPYAGDTILNFFNRLIANENNVFQKSLMAEILIICYEDVHIDIGKEAFYGQLEMPLAEAYDYAADVMVRNMLHRDSEEGIGAFLEKRPPDWDDA